MNHIRWTQLMNDESTSFTDEEQAQGWHFCCEWDGLLINPEMPEYEACTCRLKGL